MLGNTTLWTPNKYEIKGIIFNFLYNNDIFLLVAFDLQVISDQVSLHNLVHDTLLLKNAMYIHAYVIKMEEIELQILLNSHKLLWNLWHPILVYQKYWG